MGTTTDHALRYPEHGDSPAGFTQIQNLADDVDAALPVRSRGKSIIAGGQSTASSTFVELGTPDRVSGIVLPTDGLILISFEAEVTCAGNSVNNYAALFLDTTQLRDRSNAVQQAAITATAPWRLETQAGVGLALVSSPSTISGFQIGAHSFVSCRAAAGTYDVSVRYKAGASDQVNVVNRKLRVWSVAFA